MVFGERAEALAIIIRRHKKTCANATYFVRIRAGTELVNYGDRERGKVLGKGEYICFRIHFLVFCCIDALEPCVRRPFIIYHLSSIFK